MGDVHELVSAAIAKQRAGQPSPYSDVGGMRPATVAKPDPWQWISASQLCEELPPVPWKIPALQIGPGRPCSVQAYGGGMKSLTVASASVAASAGMRVWGYFDVPAPCRIRWIDYEMGRRATQRRFQRLAFGLGVDLRSLPLAISALPKARLTDTEALDFFTRAADGADIVVIDSLRAATRGVDENDSAIRDYVDTLLDVSDKTSTTFIVIHHCGKQKEGHGDKRQKGRGSSALFDAWGTVFDLEKLGEGKRTVTMTKSHPEAGAPLEPFTLEVFDVPNGSAPDAGVVVEYVEAECPASGEVVRAKEDADVARVQAELLKAMVRCKAALTNREEVLALIPGTRGLKVRALTGLKSDGRVVVEPRPEQGGRQCYRVA